MFKRVCLRGALIGALATPAAFAQNAALNPSSEAIQVPATALFFEQGTEGSRVTANVGARHGALTWSFGIRSPERSTNLFTSASGFLNDARFTLTLTYARYETEREFTEFFDRVCDRLHLDTCDERIARNHPGLTPAERERILRHDTGGGPNIFFLSGGFNHMGLSYRNEAQGGATQEDSRFVGNIRFGFGRYLTAGGLAAVSFNYEMNAKPPDQVRLCQNHPVNGMTTTPPTLQCDDVYLRGYTGTQTINLRAEWRQYLSRNLAWNPSVTFPWQAREGEGSGGGWGALQMRYLDIDTPFYARFGEDLGAKTSLHFGVRPQMRIWTETRSGSPVELNLSVFLGGSFSLFPL